MLAKSYRAFPAKGTAFALDRARAGRLTVAIQTLNYPDCFIDAAIELARTTADNVFPAFDVSGVWR